MSHIPTLFAVAGSICMSSCLSVVLKQAGREDGAQMLSLITMIITILIFLGLLDEAVTLIRRTFWI
jgi:hypothetical protein